MARSIPPTAGPSFARFHAGFERRFETLRHGYSRLLRELVSHRLIIPVNDGCWCSVLGRG